MHPTSCPAYDVLCQIVLVCSGSRPKQEQCVFRRRASGACSPGGAGPAASVLWGLQLQQVPTPCGHAYSAPCWCHGQASGLCWPHRVVFHRPVRHSKSLTSKSLRNSGPQRGCRAVDQLWEQKQDNSCSIFEASPAEGIIAGQETGGWLLQSRE